MLQLPIGPWTQQATMVHTWIHTLNPSTNQIIKQAPHSPMAQYLPQNQTCLHVYYPTTSQLSNLTPTQYPVTRETQHNGFWITLPVLPISALAPSQLNPNPSSILHQIQSKLPNYAPELWTKIKPAPNQPVTTLQQYLTATTSSVMVVSNVSLNSHK